MCLKVSKGAKTEFNSDEMMRLGSKTCFMEKGELQISKLCCKGANKTSVKYLKEKLPHFYH